MEKLEELKEKLKSYNKKNIEFNKHAENQLILREGKKEEVIEYILNPEKLVYSYQEKGKKGNTIYCLHFKVSNTRTIRLPVIFNKGNKKNLHIITYHIL